MSALSFLSEYRSDSDSEYELENNPPKRAKLHVPNLNKVPVVAALEQDYRDDPQLHGGRLRSFPHVRGNWATFVFVRYQHSLNDLLQKLEEQILTIAESCHRCDDFHVSVSKTFVLKYHLISSFSTSLQNVLKSVDSFELSFAGIKIYCNEENSRTFISLEVDAFTAKVLLGITQKVDQVLEDFKLPTFYEDPSFHMSVLWVHGNKKSELNSIVESLNEILNEVSAQTLITTLVKSINCKVGNKLFQYSLS